MSLDYGEELKKYPDAVPEERAELEKLSNLQKDIAVADSVEDFIRHPFFKTFENHLNDVINDSKGAIMKIESVEALRAHQAAIKAVVEIKQWLNAKVIAGRVGRQAIELYEQETEDLNRRVQEAIDKSVQQ